MKISREYMDFYENFSFDGTYNSLAINHILDQDNLYRFAYENNIRLGNKINIINENSLINGIRLEDLFYKDPIYLDIKTKTSTAVVCDYIRYKLICEYGFNNFIDLDVVIDPNYPILKRPARISHNFSAILFNDVATRYLYNRWIAYYKKGNIITDSEYKMPTKYSPREHTCYALYISPLQVHCKSALVIDEIKNVKNLYCYCEKNNSFIISTNFYNKLLKDKYDTSWYMSDFSKRIFLAALKNGLKFVDINRNILRNPWI